MIPYGSAGLKKKRCAQEREIIVILFSENADFTNMHVALNNSDMVTCGNSGNTSRPPECENILKWMDDNTVANFSGSDYTSNQV